MERSVAFQRLPDTDTSPPTAELYRDCESRKKVWRSNVVGRLKTSYLKDKVALRAMLYGLTDRGVFRCLIRS